MICINEKYYQDTARRNDIYRKFEKQFKQMMHPNFVDSEMYVDYSSDRYNRAFNDFETNSLSELKFFVGFAGIGKTTFIKHYFNFSTFEIKQRGDSLIVPMGWNGLRVPANGNDAIIKQFADSLYNIVAFIYKPYPLFLYDEIDEVVSYIKKTRQDILCELTIGEFDEDLNSTKMKTLQLQKTQQTFPIEFACSLLKYVLEYHNTIYNRLLFIVDDTETLSEKAISHLVSQYLSIWACLQNTRSKKIITDILISLRPHSFRYLKKNLNNGISPPYGPIFVDYKNVIYKNDIPNIKEIFKKRFEYAIRNTPKPGNPITWENAKEVLYYLIDNFDDSIIDMVADLCHHDIRSITSCFEMILSNRVWCQEIDGDILHPTVKDIGDYKFDIVNVVRTLACGESSVYLGEQGESGSLEYQDCPSFDGSPIFIPNIFINLTNKNCDILAALIMRYLECYHANGINSPLNSERMQKKTLCDKIWGLFQNKKTRDEINAVLDYLFQNRIIRKSLYSEDGESTINCLQDNDYIYFTDKGSRLLKMLENDSVLLEIYREDIRRDYPDRKYEDSAFTLIKNGKRNFLFEDLIKLANEIFINEDDYCYTDHFNADLFYNEKFAISLRIISGIKSSLNRSSLDKDVKSEIWTSIVDLENSIQKRIKELLP